MPQIPSELEVVWRGAPTQHSPHYHRVFHRVARVLQTSMRARVDVAWDPVAHAAEPMINLSVLAWLSAEPAREMSVADFTYDVLNPRLMASFYWSARRRLPERMKQLWVELNRREACDLARAYRPSRVTDVISALKKRRNPLARLIGAENAAYGCASLFRR